MRRREASWLPEREGGVRRREASWLPEERGIPGYMPPCIPWAICLLYTLGRCTLLYTRCTCTRCTPAVHADTSEHHTSAPSVEERRPLCAKRVPFSSLRIMVLGQETGPLEPRNPLQKAPAHKDLQNMLRSQI